VSAPPREAAVVVGTRASLLARAQTGLVIRLMTDAWPDLECEETVIATTGDRTQASGEPLPEIGGKGLFTAELERALRERRIDLAVHSLKDLPTEDADGVVVGAVTAREDVRDCVVARDGSSLVELAEGAVVGTSSLRRSAQLRMLRPDFDVRSIRGNVDTRVRKVSEGEFDAAVLAAAGIRRLGLEQAVTEWLAVETMLPAPGQGALAIQCRADDASMRSLLANLDDPSARAETTAERAFLGALGAGCAAPVAALAVATTTPRVRLQGLVASVDGRDVVRVSGEGEPHELGVRLAEESLADGADRILATIRG
jgi:hydroxymethylbilane synthase